MVFIQSPLVDKFEQQLILNPDCKWDVGFALRKDNNLTKVYKHDLDFRLIIPKATEVNRHQKNVVIEGFSTAKSGTGKSTVFVGEAYNILMLNYPNYCAVKFVDNFVHWSLAEFRQKVKLTKDMVACCHCFDETRRREGSIGVGSSAITMGISDLISVCRIKGLSVIRIMPSEARHQTINPHYRIDVNKMEVETGRNLSLLQDNDLRYRGHIITKKPDVKELWKAYDEKKAQFVDKVLDDSYDGRMELYKDMVKQLSEHPDFDKCENNADYEWLAMEVLGAELPKKLFSIIINRAKRLR